MQDSFDMSNGTIFGVSEFQYSVNKATGPL